MRRTPLRASSWLARLLALALGLLLVESASYVVLWCNDHEPPTSARRMARVAAAREAAAVAGDDRPLEVIHPYLGFVYNPEADSAALRALHHAPISRFGFFGPAEPARGRDPDRLVVGLFGGSFASWTYLDARHVLAERLGRDPRLAGRAVVVLDFALGGYKQPQQLLALAYAAALGIQLDVVVNVDGFNEVVLPIVENLPKGVSLVFPRTWYLRTAEVQPGPLLRRVARLDTLETRRTSVARIASWPLLRPSATAHLLWRALDRSLTNRIGHAQRDLLRAKGDAPRYASTGPFPPPPGQDAALTEVVAIWRDASLHMDRLVGAGGGRYLHFLQPNQYLEGSKPLAQVEREVAFDERAPYLTLVREGYPLLQAAGRELAAAGVEFHDLSQVFADVEEPLYRDTCCHVNAVGSERVAAAIADAVLAGPIPAASD